MIPNCFAFNFIWFKFLCFSLARHQSEGERHLDNALSLQAGLRKLMPVDHFQKLEDLFAYADKLIKAVETAQRAVAVANGEMEEARILQRRLQFQDPKENVDRNLFRTRHKMH